MKSTLILLGVFYLNCTVLKLNAQMYFPFDEQTFNTSNKWKGDTQSFKTNIKHQLQLDAKQSVRASIFHPINSLDRKFWRFDFKLDFLPSNQNKLTFYLGLDNPDNIINAYTIEIGETGNKDVIRLFKTRDGLRKEIATGIEGAFSKAPVEGTLQIEHTNNQWICHFLPIGELNYVTQFKITDTFNLPLKFFGIKCDFTSSRKSKFFFDNIILGSLPLDIKPPILDSLKVIDSLHLALFFDETIMLDKHQPSQVFRLNHGNYIVQINNNGSKSLLLTTQYALASGIDYFIQIMNIQDQAHNQILDSILTFTYDNIQQAKPFDLIINEFMSDPSPAQGLPDVEYIELRNRSEKYLNLSDYTLSDDTKQVGLPSYKISPSEIILLCNIKDTAILSPFGTSIGIEGIPSLNNSGDDIILLDLLGNIIDQVSYDLSLYKSSSKSNGGWSIERKFDQDICLGNHNWAASKNINGGTPGLQNSFIDSIVHQKPIKLNYINIESPYELVLHFNQALIFKPNNFLEGIKISPHLDIINCSQDFEQKNTITISLNSPLIKSRFYHIEFIHKIYNCVGDPWMIIRVDSFAMAELPQKGDILINEILFDPLKGGADFLELINISEKVLDISNLKIGNINMEDSIIIYPKIEQHILPKQIVAFSVDPSKIRAQYLPIEHSTIIKSRLPPWSNELGNITIFQSFFGKNYILDKFDYMQEYHHPALSDVEGVSLERYDINTPSDQISNWNSAAASFNYATPGYKNSNIKLSDTNNDQNIYLSQNHFSPNGDGFEDLLIINYILNQANTNITMKVYDLNGHFISEITKGEIQGNHGFFAWNGIDYENKPCINGIYIILAELLHIDSTSSRVKLAFVLK